MGCGVASNGSGNCKKQQRLCIGLLDNEELLAVACGWLVVDELQITAVAVTPQRRRAGLGSRVLQGLLSQASQLGASRATLEVSASNKASRWALCPQRLCYGRHPSRLLPQWRRCPDPMDVLTGHGRGSDCRPFLMRTTENVRSLNCCNQQARSQVHQWI